MTLFVGLALLLGSILLVRSATRLRISGNRFWTHAADSAWLPLVVTAMFGFGIVSTLAGVVRAVGG